MKKSIINKYIQESIRYNLREAIDLTKLKDKLKGKVAFLVSTGDGHEYSIDPENCEFDGKTLYGSDDDGKEKQLKLADISHLVLDENKVTEASSDNNEVKKRLVGKIQGLMADLENVPKGQAAVKKKMQDELAKAKKELSDIVNNRTNINEKISTLFIKYKVHNDKTIGFYDSSFDKELGTLDIHGGFETTSDEACDALVRLFKQLEIPVKTEKTHGGSPNIVMSKTAVVKLLTMIKNRPMGRDKIGTVKENNLNESGPTLGKWISEAELFHDLTKLNANGRKAVEKMEGIDTSEYDTDSIAAEYEDIFHTCKLPYNITDANMNSTGDLKFKLEKRGINEISQSDKTKQVAAIDLQISTLQKKKEVISKQEVSETTDLQHGTENDKQAKELKTKLDSEFKSDNFTLQKMDNGRTLLRYQYWAELPSSIYNKLKANYDIKLETDYDEDTGVLHMYFLTKKKGINEANEDEAGYDNKFSKTVPTGYQFTSKPLTTDGKKRLAGYWLQCANVNDKKAELKADGKYSDDWLIKYKTSVDNCLSYLLSKGFIKRVKQ